MKRPAPAHGQGASISGEASRLLDDLSLNLAQARTGGSVHGARRGIKRLRSLLRLIRPGIGEAAFRQGNALLKTAADALAGRRRAEALVMAAAKVKASGRVAGRLKGLAERHRDAQVPVTDALPAAQQAIAAAVAAAQTWNLPGGSGRLLRDAFVKTYGKARKRLAKALNSGDAAALHEARKQVIHHLHHLELLRQFLAADQTERISRLEALREVLGDLNDLDELAQLAETGDGTADDAMRAAMEKRRSKLIKQAKGAWKPLFRHGSSAFAERIDGRWDEAAA